MMPRGRVTMKLVVLDDSCGRWMTVEVGENLEWDGKLMDDAEGEGSP